VLKLFLVVSLLRLKFHKFTFSINQSSLLILKCESLVIEDSVEVVNAGKSLGDIVLYSPYFCGVLNALLAL
jgi:hypothetical protein